MLTSPTTTLLLQGLGPHHSRIILHYCFKAETGNKRGFHWASGGFLCVIAEDVLPKWTQPGRPGCPLHNLKTPVHSSKKQ